MCYNGSGQQQLKCASKMCYSRYLFKESKYEAKCDVKNKKSNISILVIEIHVLTEVFSSNINSSVVPQLIEYACGFNECSSQATFNQIHSAINQHYNLSALYNLVSANNQVEQTLYTSKSSLNDILTSQSIYTTTMDKYSSCSMQFPVSITVSLLNIFVIAYHMTFFAK